MTTHRLMALSSLLTLAALSAVTAVSAAALEPWSLQRGRTAADLQASADELVAQARLHAELGAYENALALYEGLAADRAQPLPVRGRANAGMAAMQAQLGRGSDALGSLVEAFHAARELKDLDLATEAFQVIGLRIVPNAAWEDVEPRLDFERRRDEGGRERLMPPDGLLRDPVLVRERERSALAAWVDWPEAKYTGQPISLSLKDAPIGDLLRMFRQISGLNIDLDPSLAGEMVTLDIHDVPWDLVLALIVEQKGLHSRLDGDVLRIGADEGLPRWDGTPARPDGTPARWEETPVRRDERRLAPRELDARVSSGTEATEEGSREGTSRAFSGEPISMELDDADLLDLLQMFSSIAGVEIRLDPAVRNRKVSFKADAEPWDSVLERLARAQGLEVVADGDRFLVTAAIGGD